MEKYFKKTTYRLTTLLIGLVLGCSLFVSCVEDNNYYANHEPEWLGASIYSYLVKEDTFKTYVRLIDELDYKETLNGTGSKTLFVASDAAFARFFNSNPWGVKKYENLTLAQKKLLLKFGMINDAYTSDNIPNVNINGVLQLGTALRRSSAIEVLDSIPHDYPDSLPSGSYWDKYKTGVYLTKGIYLLKDNSSSPLLQFTQKQMNQKMISDDDFSFLTGSLREKNDIHIYGIKVVKRDITCKNGYINVLSDVLIPPMNMAQYIKSNPKTQIFSRLLDRFSAPYLDKATMATYKMYQLQHPEYPVIDSIFVKGYFSVNSQISVEKNNGIVVGPDNKAINSDLYLPFDPGWNSYVRSANGSVLQTDMGAIFVPSNDAMTSYLTSGGILSKYKNWDEIPDKIVISFLKKLMRSSLITSLPSRFGKMVDEQNYPLPVAKSDIESGNVYLGVNGAVCVTNKVYIPEEYASIYAPVLFSDTTKVIDWFIQNYGGDVPLYKFYLNSLVNKYSFFVPSDAAFAKYYIDPVAYSKNIPAVIKFWYNRTSNPAIVNATMYQYDKVTGSVVGDSILITDVDFIKNRLLDIMETHIVVNGVESGDNYYLAKGNNVVHIKSGSGNSTIVEGGGDMFFGTQVNTTNSFIQSNGNTYIIDKMIQSPLNSVYKILSDSITYQGAFTEFFNLINNYPKGKEIFKPQTSKAVFEGMDYNIKLFNTFNYTVYAPTNAAIKQAIKDTLFMTWDAINKLPTTPAAKLAYKNYETTKLDRFIRYHVQDNSVFVGGKTLANRLFQTATIKTDAVVSPPPFSTAKNKYFKILVNSSGNTMTLKSEGGRTANVIRIPNMANTELYNIMTRDYVFNYNPNYFNDIDGSGGKTTSFTSSRIETSSTAVIHLIDNVLTFQ